MAGITREIAEQKEFCECHCICSKQMFRENRGCIGLCGYACSGDRRHKRITVMDWMARNNVT